MMAQFKATNDWYKNMAKLEEGHDISAGSQRMEQPTKEEVEKMKRRVVREGAACLSTLEAMSLIDTYLALREEVEELEWKAKSLCVELGNAFMEKTKLQADNQALRERLEKMEESREREIQDAINDYRGGQHGY